MIFEKFIYLIFFYNNLYLYLLLLLFIRNIKYLEKLVLIPSNNKNNIYIYNLIENCFCLFINNLIKCISLVYNKVSSFFNQTEDKPNNIIIKSILYVYNKISELDNKLYNMMFNYIKDILFKKITTQIMEEMTKTSKDNNNLGNIDNILSNSMKMFDDILKNKNINKNDLNNISKMFGKGLDNMKNNDVMQKILNDMKMSTDIKNNNNLILSNLKDKFN